MGTIIIFVCIGVLCGILGATLGVGSGILLIPVLVIFYHFPQKSAQGIALSVMVPMTLMGAIRYGMNPGIPMDYTVVAWLAVGGVIGAFFGAAFAGALPAHVLRKAFAVLLVIAAIRMFTLPAEGIVSIQGPLDKTAAVQEKE